MKRRIFFSIAFALSVAILSLLSSDSTAQAQNQLKVIADTGIVTLGPNQTLRVSVATGDVDRDGAIFRFKRIKYAPQACNNGVCKLALSSQTISNPITLTPGEAASLELVASTYGRGTILSNSPDLRVTVHIIDSVTGQVVSVVPVIVATVLLR